MAEVPDIKKDPIEEQKTREQKEQREEEDRNNKINTEIWKEGGGDTGEAMKIAGQNSVNAIKSGFSAEEKNNPAYNAEFTTLQGEFDMKTKNILSGKWTSEEKTQELQMALREFEAKIGNIKWGKEAQDAERGKLQAENMQEKNQKDRELTKNFQEKLLKNLAEITENKRQAEKQKIIMAWNTEQEDMRRNAGERIDAKDGGPFGPPGIAPEKPKMA